MGISMFERKDLYAYGAARKHEMSWWQKVAFPAILGGAVDVFTQLKHPGTNNSLGEDGE